MAKFRGGVIGYAKNGKQTTEVNRQGSRAIEASLRSWVGSVSFSMYYAGDEEKAEDLRIRVLYQWDESTAHPRCLCFDGWLSDFISALSNYTGDQD